MEIIDGLREYLQKHKRITWIVLLSYIVFNGCFFFPFSNERFAFTLDKGFIVITTYGMIGIGFACILKRGKSLMVLMFTFCFTIIGLICRYFLEYGEVSNIINFIPINIISYLIIIPVYCMAVYWAIYKWSKVMQNKID